MYIPPYLTEGRTQPQFTLPEREWTYGGTYSFTVNLFHGTTDTMRVSLIAGALSANSARGVVLISDYSHIVYSRQHDGCSHSLPRIHVQRQHLYRDCASQRQHLSSWLASNVCPRRTHAVVLALDPHRWRSRRARQLAELPRLHSSGRRAAVRRATALGKV